MMNALDKKLRSPQYIGIRRVLERGSALVLQRTEDGILVFDRPSGGHMLIAPDPDTGRAWFTGAGPIHLLFTDEPELVTFAHNELGLPGCLACRQLVYLHPDPPAPDPRLLTRLAVPEDLPWLAEHYRMISPEEQAQVVASGLLMIGLSEGKRIGFIGEHLEGTMGLLYVLPEYRRRGYGEALEREMLAVTLRRGDIPFVHVITDNHMSLALQQKLGLTLTPRPVYWATEGIL